MSDPPTHLTEEALERYYLAMEREEERRLAAFNAAVRHDGVRAWVVGPPLPVINVSPRNVLAEVQCPIPTAHNTVDELLAWVAAVYDLPFVRHAEIRDTEPGHRNAPPEQVESGDTLA